MKVSFSCRMECILVLLRESVDSVRCWVEKKSSLVIGQVFIGGQKLEKVTYRNCSEDREPNAQPLQEIPFMVIDYAAQEHITYHVVLKEIQLLLAEVRVEGPKLPLELLSSCIQPGDCLTPKAPNSRVQRPQLQKRRQPFIGHQLHCCRHVSPWFFCSSKELQEHVWEKTKLQKIKSRDLFGESSESLLAWSDPTKEKSFKSWTPCPYWLQAVLHLGWEIIEYFTSTMEYGSLLLGNICTD